MKDPVCGMEVTPESAAGNKEWHNETYFFCSSHCLEKFRADPAEYLDHPALGTSSHDSQEKLVVPVKSCTCPMHPEINQDKPGSCPKCGMALEPLISPASVERIEYTCPMHPEI